MRVIYRRERSEGCVSQGHAHLCKLTVPLARKKKSSDIIILLFSSLLLFFLNVPLCFKRITTLSPSKSLELVGVQIFTMSHLNEEGKKILKQTFFSHVYTDLQIKVAGGQKHISF